MRKVSGKLAVKYWTHKIKHHCFSWLTHSSTIKWVPRYCHWCSGNRRLTCLLIVGVGTDVGPPPSSPPTGLMHTSRRKSRGGYARWTFWTAAAAAWTCLCPVNLSGWELFLPLHASSLCCFIYLGGLNCVNRPSLLYYIQTPDGKTGCWNVGHTKKASAWISGRIWSIFRCSPTYDWPND